MHVIVGLGNPGEQYKLTRHNVGWLVIDALADKLGLAWEYNKRFKADVAKSGDYLLLKPQTFMNNSGESVRAALDFYSLLPKKLGLIRLGNQDLSGTLTVVHDEIDLKLGKTKISVDSTSAGHRGVGSIINHLKTKNFRRLRIGIGSIEPTKIPTVSYVLQKFPDDELDVVKAVIPEAIKGL